MTDLVQVLRSSMGSLKTSHDELFDFNQINTRGHSLKIRQQSCRLNFRNFSLIALVIPIWNNLPSCIAETRTVGDFKRKLDTMT